MAELPACEASAVTPQFEQFRSAPLGVPWNGHRVFPHRLSGESPISAHAQRAHCLRFQRHRSENGRARNDHAFGIPFTQGIPRFCRTMLALGSPCKARGAQEYDAPNGGSLDADSANIGARRHLRSIGRALGVDADPARRRSAKAVAGRFQGCESMSSFLPAVCGLDFLCRISEPYSAIRRNRLRASYVVSARINGTVGQICRANGGSIGGVSWQVWWGASRPHLFIEGARPCAWR
jgi:hypothetical protein